MNAAVPASGQGELVTEKYQQSDAVEITFASGRRPS